MHLTAHSSNLGHMRGPVHLSHHDIVYSMSFDKVNRVDGWHFQRVSTDEKCLKEKLVQFVGLK